MGGYVILFPMPHRGSLTYKNCSLCAMLYHICTPHRWYSKYWLDSLGIPVHCGLGGRRVSEQEEHRDIVAFLTPKAECDFSVSVYFFRKYG